MTEKRNFKVKISGYTFLCCQELDITEASLSRHATRDQPAEYKGGKINITNTIEEITDNEVNYFCEGDIAPEIVNKVTRLIEVLDEVYNNEVFTLGL